MFKIKTFFRLFISWGLCGILCECTENPFGEDGLGGSKISGLRSIEGMVSLNDNANPDDVFVWMEIFGSSTYTDDDGHFILTLPNKAVHGGSGGISGFYRVFFYVANYLLDSVLVIVKENEFVYGKGDVNTAGILSPNHVMRKYLDIKTTLDRRTISASYDSLITVTIRLRATIDLALVNFPLADYYIGYIFVKNIDSDAYYTYLSYIMMHLPYRNGDWIAVEKERPATITMVFSLFNRPLPTGKYEIIPYFFTSHDRVQEDFMKNLFPNWSTPDSNFLNIPMKREGGYLEVNE